MIENLQASNTNMIDLNIKSVPIVSLPIIDCRKSLFTTQEKEELRKEYERHHRNARQIFLAILRDLKRQFKIFLKPNQRNLKIPLDLNDIETRIQQDYYKIPKDLLGDIEVINSSVLENSYASDELILKVFFLNRLRD